LRVLAALLSTTISVDKINVIIAARECRSTVVDLRGQLTTKAWTEEHEGWRRAASAMVGYILLLARKSIVPFVVESSSPGGLLISPIDQLMGCLRKIGRANVDQIEL
jgi:hypothetical protein